MRNLFTDFPISGSFTLSANDSRHVLIVLRHTVGDILHVTDSLGATYECRITGTEGRIAVLVPIQKISEGGEGNGNVILAAGLLKSDKFDWVVQKAAELGVSTVVPVQMEHCVVKLNDTRAQNRISRWQRIAEEAAKQCGRRDIPEVLPVLTVPALVERYPATPFIVPYEQETEPIHEACSHVRTGDVVLVIGSEGGFAKDEIFYLQEHTGSCRTVSLGPRILRAETAALAALSIVMYERGFM